MIEHGDDPNDITNEIGRDFLLASPRWFKAGFIDDRGVMVGHLLSSVEGKILHVWHMKFDVPMTRLERKEISELLFDWGRGNGCTESESYVDTEAQARRLQIFYGYKRHKILMRKALKCESTAE